MLEELCGEGMVFAKDSLTTFTDNLLLPSNFLEVLAVSYGMVTLINTLKYVAKDNVHYWRIMRLGIYAPDIWAWVNKFQIGVGLHPLRELAI